MFYEEFVFFLGGSPASSAIDDNLDVFNEKMGQNFNLSWVVRIFLQTPRLFQPPRLLILVICADPPAYSGLKSSSC